MTLLAGEIQSLDQDMSAISKCISVVEAALVFMPDISRTVKLAQQLIATNSESPPGREREVADVLVDHMSAYGISHKSVGPHARPNLIFYTGEDISGQLVLHGHMDTVPVGELSQWSVDPFAGSMMSGRLYGRGSCDMKGPLATLAETVIRHKESGNKTPLLFLCTSDEESGCSGAEVVADSGLLAGVSYGVCAEPTDLSVLVGERGMLWTKAVARGKAAHGSRPHEGINAIQLCMRAVDELLRHEYPYEADELMGEMTASVGMINGGIKINVVPDYCEAYLDMRTVKGQESNSMLLEMNRVLEEHHLSDRVEVEYVHGKAAVVTPEDALIVKVAIDATERVAGKRSSLSAATFGTDCSVLQPRIGILNVICGPGSIEQAHQPDEFISIHQLEQAVDIYSKIAEQFSSDESS
jgi:succinyl-diaminopimelate desuccinylase